MFFIAVSYRRQMANMTNHRVFIAYSRRDIAAVEILASELELRGIKIFRDLTDIGLGEPWRDRLVSLIKSADTILFPISPASMSSPICRWEVEYAENLGKRLLPVLIERVSDDMIPARLGRLQYLVLTDRSDRAAFDTLAAAVRAGAKYGQGAQEEKIFLSRRARLL
jgi:hypothetical protein